MIVDNNMLLRGLILMGLLFAAYWIVKMGLQKPSFPQKRRPPVLPVYSVKPKIRPVPKPHDPIEVIKKRAPSNKKKLQINAGKLKEAVILSEILNNPLF